MIDVYYAPPSIYGRKVITVLQEKDLDYSIKKMSFTTKDHLKEDYLKLNPNGEIPTISDDGQVIYESTAIIEYLNDEYPEPPLMPEDSYERAKVRMIEDFIDLHLYRHIVKYLVKKFIRKEEVPAEDINAIANDFKRIETYLGSQKYLVGNFSLADCAMIPAVISAEGFGFSNMTTSPKLKTYTDSLKKRKSYQAVLSLTNS